MWLPFLWKRGVTYCCADILRSLQMLPFYGNLYKFNKHFHSCLCFAVKISMWWWCQNVQEPPAFKFCTAVVVPFLPQCIFFPPLLTHANVPFIPESLSWLWHSPNVHLIWWARFQLLSFCVFSQPCPVTLYVRLQQVYILHLSELPQLRLAAICKEQTLHCSS